MSAWVAFVVLVAAWACICLSQAKHHARMFGAEGTRMRRRLWSLAGTAGFVAMFAWLVLLRGWEFGPVLWSVLLCLAALAWTVGLALATGRAPARRERR